MLKIAVQFLLSFVCVTLISNNSTSVYVAQGYFKGLRKNYTKK